jgi:lipopolysaccharide transport system ATP-binding protein
MEQLWDSNATVLLVSHNLDDIQKSCTRAVWLDRGKIRYMGTTDETAAEYLNAVNQGMDIGLHHSLVGE